MARKMERWLGLAPTDRAACIMPIHYNAGFKATLLAPLLIGCSVAFSEFGRPKELVEELATLRPTWLTAAPAWLEALVDTLRQSPNKPEHTLRFILSTASYLPARTGSALQGLLGVPVAEFYGLCEAGMMTGPLLGTERELGFVGRPPPGELVLKGEDGRDVPVGEPGEIVLRGPSVTPGYIGDDIDAAPVGLDGGWLATGDLGVLDGRGNLKVIARSKEIINRGGEKISPYDVERALLAHPAVRQAAAFAIPHGRLGELVSAAVVLDPEAATRSDDLLDFVQQRLAPFQRPRTVHILDELPTSPTGKISRSQLSERFANERASGPLPDSPLEMLIARIWCERLQRPEIGLDEDFFEIGGDSLLATEMLVEVETTLGQHVRPSDIGNRLTVRILAQALKRTAASTGEVGYLAKEGGGAPLFLCHGDFDGWGLYGFRLARLLKREGPIHLLHSLLDDRRGIVSLEAMVSAYMSYVETAAPTGPVRTRRVLSWRACGARIGQPAGGSRPDRRNRRVAGRDVPECTPAVPVGWASRSGRGEDGPGRLIPSFETPCHVLLVGALHACGIARTRHRLTDGARREDRSPGRVGRHAARSVLPRHGQPRAATGQGGGDQRCLRRQCPEGRICSGSVVPHREPRPRSCRPRQPYQLHHRPCRTARRKPP